MSSILNKYKKVYFVGIKGVGMTMLAQFLKERGSEVSGSDTDEVFLTDKVLKKEKIKVLSFSAENISPDVNLVVHSSAYSPENNPELAYLVKQKKVKILNYASALGEIFSNHSGVAICGSHGKTTTSAWLGYVLWKSGLSPNVLVGSSVPQFGGASSLIGNSKIFVAEADEYQNKLQYFFPYGVVLNNIDYDHPDFFKTRESYFRVFQDFILRIPKNGFLVANHSDKKIRGLYQKTKGWVLNYDLVKNEKEYLKKKKEVNFLAFDHYFKDGQQFFKVNDFGEFKIKMLGRHNIYNALAVIAASYALGVEIKLIKKHLGDFLGTTRRAQYLGDFNGVKIFDDYAHHPTEVKATVAAFKDAYPNKKLLTVFHPHTFTRTRALFNDFKKSFVGIDKLVIIDIYGSARETQGGTSSQKLIKAIKDWNKEHGIKQKVIYQKNLLSVENYLRKSVKKGDLLLLMGAGDIFRVGEKLIS